VKHPFYSIRPRIMFGRVSEHFADLRHVKRNKTCVLGLKALFQGIEVAKHPFYCIRTEMMFGSVSEHFANLRHVKTCKTCVSEHFANLRHVKRCKTCVSSLNALFQGTEVAKHQFYSIRPK
jgi:acid stress-induced BolA-like protein IbaG/YrbA